MTRIKPQTSCLVFKSLEDADNALAEIAEHRRRISVIEAYMNQDVDALKQKALEETAPHRAGIAGLEAALARYAEYNRDELFAGRKSLELAFGTIGWRASTKLKLLGKMTWERVLQALRDHGLRDLIRVKEEVDKEAMKGLAQEHLKDLGCKLAREDVFFYELKEESIASESP